MDCSAATATLIGHRSGPRRYRVTAGAANRPSSAASPGGTRGVSSAPSGPCRTARTSPSWCARETRSPLSYGTMTLTWRSRRGSSRSISRSRSSIPAPVRAETTTDPRSARRSPSSSMDSAASALLITTSSGTSPAPISPSTSRTAAIWARGSASEPSTTCRIRPASATSSSVDRKASTSWCGRCRTKPTVSVSVKGQPDALRALRTAGSSVANSETSTRTSAPVSRFTRLAFPALVYPAIATDGTARRPPFPPRLRRPAGGHVGRRVRPAAAVDQAVQDLRSRGLGQPGQLTQRVLGRGQGAVRPDPHQDPPLQPQRAVLDLGDVLELGGQPGYPAQCVPVLQVQLPGILRLGRLRVGGGRNSGRGRGARRGHGQLGVGWVGG